MHVGVERPINRTHLKAKAIVTSATCKDTQHKIAGTKSRGHQDLMVTTTIAKSMDIEILSADQSLCGHLINQQGETTMHTITIGTTIQGKVVTIVKSMDIYLKIALEHISKEIIPDG